MPALDVAELLADHLRPLRANARAGIAAHRHQSDFHREGNMSDEVTAEDHRAGEYRNDGDLRLAAHARGRVVGDDLGSELADAGGDLLLRDEDPVDVPVHGPTVSDGRAPD